MTPVRPYQIVDHLFRHEYGKMVAVLARKYGINKLEMIEDAVQDSFHKALLGWKFEGPPENPPAWLMRVAKNRAIDLMRKERTKLDHKSRIQDLEEKEYSDNELYLDEEIADIQLRLIFTCCHPGLHMKDKIAFTLKTVSGFSIKEIAKALLAKEGTIKKRLFRARNQLIKNKTEFIIPNGSSLKQRLEAVHAVIYLMFNEGYSASKGDEIIRKDLCAEAMRLCKILEDHKLVNSSDGKALLALMCYHAARFDSRLDQQNDIILLADQDRTKWNYNLIGIGNRYMNAAMNSDKFSVYHVEAAIAAEHCMASSFANTNWHNLLKLYELLSSAKSGPVCSINKIVVLLQLGRLDQAHAILTHLDESSFPGKVYLYHSIAAEVYQKMGDSSLAMHHMNLARNSALTKTEYKLIQKKIIKLSSNSIP